MPRNPPIPPPPVLAPALSNSPTLGSAFPPDVGGQTQQSPPPTPYDPQPVYPSEQAALDTPAVSALNKALRSAGADPIPTNPQEQILALLKMAGADTTNPELLALIPGLVPYWGGYADAQKQAFIASQVAAHPAPQAPGVADYSTAVKEYGFSAGFSDYTSSLIAGIGRPGSGQAAKALEKITTQDFVINPDNGALLFKNGVIFDPATGDLHFPQGDPSIVGSSAWMHSVTRWSPDKVLEWRKTLGEQGYLPVTDALNGSGAVDANFLQAISAYQTARYQNYGTPIAQSSVDLSQYGPQGNKIFDLSQVRGSIVSQVRSQYRTTFGQDPSSGELKNWTDFVIRTGMSLQQTQGLDASQASSEALAQFGNRAENSPQANFIQDRADENTSLHDALTSAVAATASVTR